MIEAERPEFGPANFVTVERLRALAFERQVLIPPHHYNDERNTGVAALHEIPRQLHLLNSDKFRMDVDGSPAQKTYLKDGPSDSRRILNVFIQNPDAYIRQTILNSIMDTTCTHPIENMNRRLGGEVPFIEEYNFGNGILYKLAGDVQIIDDRSHFDRLPLGEDDFQASRRRLGQQVVASSLEIEDGLNEQYRVSRIKFYDSNDALSKSPTRYGQIHNIATVNSFTEGMALAYTEKFPQKPPMIINKFVIMDDQRAELNGQAFPVGPLQRRVMHRLMINYFSGSLDVLELRNKLVEGSFSAIQGFLGSLEGQGVVRLERDKQGIIIKANLLLMTFEDRRQSPRSGQE